MKFGLSLFSVGICAYALFGIKAATALDLIATQNAYVDAANTTFVSSTPTKPAANLVVTGGTKPKNAFLRFDVSVPAGQKLLGAKLLIYTTTAVDKRPGLFFAPFTPNASRPDLWVETNTTIKSGSSSVVETAINATNQPTALIKLYNDSVAAAAGSWIEYDVSARVTSAGTYNFALLPLSTNAITITSRADWTPPSVNYFKPRLRLLYSERAYIGNPSFSEKFMDRSSGKIVTLYMPGPTNTGVQTAALPKLVPIDSTTLNNNIALLLKNQPYKYITVSQGKYVLENFDITGQLDLLGVSKFVVRNCRINGGYDTYHDPIPGGDGHGRYYGINAAGLNSSPSDILIQNVTISQVRSAFIVGYGFTAIGVQGFHSGGDAFKPGNNSVIQSSWVYDLGYAAPSAHSDGAQIVGGHDVKMIGNFFDMPSGKIDTKTNSALDCQGGTVDQLPYNISFVGNWVVAGEGSATHCYSDRTVDPVTGPGHKQVGRPETNYVTNNYFAIDSVRDHYNEDQEGTHWAQNDNDISDNKFMTSASVKWAALMPSSQQPNILVDPMAPDGPLSMH